jgi:Flp pilus assembly protein TadB
MTWNAHDEARTLIALGESLSDAQQEWLRTHLDECEACLQYEEAANAVVRILRSLPLAAPSGLVRATQMRLRFHAHRLQETRQRLWLAGLASLGVGLSAMLTVPLLWRLVSWMGEWAGVSVLILQADFIFFLIAPAMVLGLLLLARRTHPTNNGERSRPWR